VSSSVGSKGSWSASNKKLTPSADGKRPLIEVGHPEPSVRRECELLGLYCSSWYYEPAAETKENLRLMRLIDGQYTDCPFYGSRRMTVSPIVKEENERPLTAPLASGRGQVPSARGRADIPQPRSTHVDFLPKNRFPKNPLSGSF
jgi:hypothetical protein